MHPRTLLLPLLFSITAAAQTANPFAGDEQAAGVGKGIFRIYCAPCHGIRGQGGRGPDLSHGVYNSGEHDSDLFRTISAGVPGTEMESYSAILSDDNIWRLVAFIRSIGSAKTASSAPPPGNAAHGNELFWGKGRCGNCHMVQDKGGKSGPNLSRIGRQRSFSHLKESIVSPSADITSGYATVSVVLRDGKKIMGLERGHDNFTVQVRDLAGKFYSFDKSSVTSVTREKRSLMPDNYGKTFTPQEVDDIVSYLSTLRGEAAKP